MMHYVYRRLCFLSSDRLFLCIFFPHLQTKKRKSAASRKKGKLSKAEKLQLQKEEEERRQREEEEAQILAEQIEAARLEKERLEREELERLEAKLERREDELAEHRTLVDEKLETAARWKKDVRTLAKWERYTLCDGSPDPTVLQEINTFMSLWSEEPPEDFQAMLDRSSLILRLIEELEFLLLDTPLEELGEAAAAEHTETGRQLQVLLQRKFDEATEQLLKNAAALSDIDTGNMQKVIQNKNVALCIWANLNKNPRFRGYDFQDQAISFDLPKPLSLSNIAVRILHTDYDHLSCQSPTFLPQVKEHEDTAGAVIPESEAGDWKPAEEDEKTAPESVAAEEELKSEERKSVLSAASHREEASEPEERSESWAADASEAHCPTPAPTDEDDMLEVDVVDLRQFTTLGGVYYFDVLVLPPQCKQVNSWSMRQLLAGGLQTFCYPQESFLSATLGVSLQEKDMEGLSSPPVRVSFKVPDNVIFFEEPQVARWDPEGRNWKTDALTDIKYNAEQRQLMFSMDAFYTFTLIQESHLHMPYASWELIPKGVNEVSLTIVSAVTDIQIDIKDGQCRLAAVSSITGDLSAVIERWMTPVRLQLAMRRVGLNVFPAEDSGKYVSGNQKNDEVENMAYKEMALLSPSFTFGWSKWNHNCSSEQIVVKVREGSGSCTDGSLYLLSRQRAQRLKISEASDTFSEERYDGSEFHTTLYHMIRDYCSAEATTRLQHSHHLFMDCVYQLLSATRVLTYS
ncbi:dynein axonemal intermediate chain 7 isoform X2 [Eleutherodactylus coqui]|uniref:dynein axonemal intermediate chain 7 isoform X2 n=1 Tax=Eleutherodactylus coqui TaxID=57060 RepID=UPI003462DE41